MVKYWTNGLLGKPSVRSNGPETLVYRANGTTIQVGVQLSSSGYMIDPSRIISWDDAPERILSDAERRNVAIDVKAVIETQWGTDAEIVDTSESIR